MSITNRNLKAGTVLVARYKKREHRCEVVAGEEGKVRYRLKDGKEFTSPSAAGSAVMGGTACNGWRFWTVEGEEKAPTKARSRATAPKKAPSKPKGKRGARKAVRGGSNGAKPDAEKVACGQCKQTFGSAGEAAEHLAKEHPQGA